MNPLSYSNRGRIKPTRTSGINAIGTIIVMVLSLLAASVINVYPVGDFLANIRPMFIFVVALFWIVHRPDLFGVGFMFVVGLVSDFLLDTGMGQQAFSAVLATFMFQYITRDSRNINDLQVWLLAGMAIIVFSISLLALQYLSGQVVIWRNGLPMITSIMIWPLIALMLKRF